MDGTANGLFPMIAYFVVPGDPVGKGRPKFSTKNGFPRAVTPEKTVNYENLVRMEYEKQCGSRFFRSDAALRMKIDVYRMPNKSASKKKRAEMIAGAIRPGKKPDMDNIIKAIQDALNKVAYEDDNQIVEVFVRKFYADEPPRANITIERIAHNG